MWFLQLPVFFLFSIESASRWDWRRTVELNNYRLSMRRQLLESVRSGHIRRRYYTPQVCLHACERESAALLVVLATPSSPTQESGINYLLQCVIEHNLTAVCPLHIQYWSMAECSWGNLNFHGNVSWIFWASAWIFSEIIMKSNNVHILLPQEGFIRWLKQLLENLWIIYTQDVKKNVI